MMAIVALVSLEESRNVGAVRRRKRSAVEKAMLRFALLKMRGSGLVGLGA